MYVHSQENFDDSMKKNTDKEMKKRLKHKIPDLAYNYATV